MTTLLSKDHPITEKGMMEFQPFGKEPDGTPIRDISGVVIRALVEYLEESVSRMHGQESSRRAVEELVQRLNERIPDPAWVVDTVNNLVPAGLGIDFCRGCGLWMSDFSIALPGLVDWTSHVSASRTGMVMRSTIRSLTV